MALFSNRHKKRKFTFGIVAVFYEFQNVYVAFASQNEAFQLIRVKTIKFHVGLLTQ